MFYLQLWAQLKNTVVSGAQSFEYFDKFYKDHIIFNFEHNPEKMIGLQFEYFHLVWKEHMLSLLLGPTKNYNFKWGSNLNTLKQDLKRTYSIFNLGPQ